MSFITKILGDPNEKAIQKIKPILEDIHFAREKFQSLSFAEFRELSPRWKEEYKEGKSLDEILPYFFAAQKEISLRKRGSEHFSAQCIGGIVLHQGKIAEVKTGEGKTSYIAPLTAGLNALTNKGVHVVTVNDYLSRRDAGWAGPLLWGLGLSVGVIVHEKSYIFDPDFIDGEGDKYTVHLRPVSRKEAYDADITYGTNNEFGFDYLRDNMASRFSQKVQRGLIFAIVDECDSIFIDEARTPLIISAPAEESADLYYKFAKLVLRLVENEDYNVDEKMRSAILSEDGMTKMEDWLQMGNIYTEGGITMVHHIEQALRAFSLYKRDRDYVVKDGEKGKEVVIVDEFTGRLMPGRRYSEGLHQAIEAKENVPIQRESRTLATITFQNYFRMYEKFSGMTGTALTEAEEFSKIYHLDVIAIPTNKPVIREDKSDRIYKSEAIKFQAVMADVEEKQKRGQPVLIGTISIEKNESLSRVLEERGISYNILNAKQHEREAHIIEEAGKAGSVTLATNMAGRGVDISLGGIPPEREDFENDEVFQKAFQSWKTEHEKVVSLGGLAVIGTGRHESRRIDNQLRGRSGRQGDPGESQFYVSLDDDLMRIFGGDRLKRLMNTLRVPDDMPIENAIVSKSLEQAQKRVEGHNFDIRKHLVEYDDVMNKHRETIYRRRDEILTLYENFREPIEVNMTSTIPLPFVSCEDGMKQNFLEMIDNEIEHIVSFHTSQEEEKEWNMEEIYEVAHALFGVPEEKKKELFELRQKEGEDKLSDVHGRTRIIEYLELLAREKFLDIEKKLFEKTGSPLAFLDLEKSILLNTIDSLWVEHLEAMSYLRTGIGLQGYGQRDPLVEYKREGYRLFVELMGFIDKRVVETIFKVGDAVVMAPEIFNTRNIEFTAPEKEMQRGGSTILRVPGQAKEISQRTVSVVSERSRDTSGNKIGRNDPCYCGSEKKFKKCHGV